MKKTIQERVILELNEMKKAGINIPAKALKMARDKNDMEEYEDNPMSISDIADLLIDLS